MSTMLNILSNDQLSSSLMSNLLENNYTGCNAKICSSLTNIREIMILEKPLCLYESANIVEIVSSFREINVFVNIKAQLFLCSSSYIEEIHSCNYSSPLTVFTLALVCQRICSAIYEKRLLLRCKHHF